MTTTAYLYDDNGVAEEEIPVTYEDYLQALELEEPDPASYGVLIPGIPNLAEDRLNAVHCADWLKESILGGIIGGVCAV